MNVNDKVHTVIDIETGKTPSDGNYGCIVFRIGLATLFLDKSITSRDIGVSPNSCASIGAAYDKDTMDWWSRQEAIAQEVRDQDPKLGIGTALQLLNDYLEETQTDYTWGNSPAFDHSILLWYYSELGITPHPSLLYQNQLDLRTIRVLYPDIKKIIEESNPLPHIAVNDALSEAIGLREYLRIFND